MISRAFRFRLAPTPGQEEKLRHFVGVTRLVYNLAWEQRRDWWRQYRAATGGNLNFISQGQQVTELRREFDWIREVLSCALAQALRDLDKAFAAFFSGRASYPSPRRLGTHDSFRIKAKEIGVRAINRRWVAVRIPNLGWIKFRATRALLGRNLNVTISRDALGWHASFACEIEHEAPANDNPAVGIDCGVAATLTLSTGEAMALPDLTTLERRARRQRRSLARSTRGSKRYAKKRARLGRITAKAARIRREWQHRASRSIAERFGLAVFEDLKIANMTAAASGKRGLNRSILNQSWGSFMTKLAYKLEERGGSLVKVNPAYSSQTCSDCGAVDAASRKSQSVFACTSCGFSANADHNAAIIILRRSTPSMPAEGSGYAPVEPGTIQVAA